MNHIRNFIKAVKKAKLEYQLKRIVDQQSILDTSLFEAELEAKVLGRVHSEMTTALAKKRTSLRSQLIRL